MLNASPSRLTLILLGSRLMRDSEDTVYVRSVQLVVAYLNYEAHGKHRPTHPVSESWGKHGHPRYLNSLLSIGSNAVLLVPGRPSKSRRGRIARNTRRRLFLPSRTRLTPVTHGFQPEIRYDSRNHPPAYTTALRDIVRRCPARLQPSHARVSREETRLFARRIRHLSSSEKSAVYRVHFHLITSVLVTNQF